MSHSILSKILIVDDKTANRHAICRILETLENIEFIHADSGEEALKLLLTHQVAVILLDINMPGMSGYETAEFISNDVDNRDTPIVMVTAQGSSLSDISCAYDAGAVDYITKPIEPKVLFNKVKQFVILDQAVKETIRIGTQRDRILNAAGEGVLEVDNEGFIQYCNARATQLLQDEGSKILGSHFNQWFHLRHDESSDQTTVKFLEIYHQVMEHDFYNIDMAIHHANGIIIPIEMNCSAETGNVSPSVTLIFQDITDRLAIETRLLTMANYDPLTGLANRAFFHTALGQALARQQRLENTLAVLFLDLDHFKYINDNYGHDAGDHLLITTGEKLRHCVRDSDLVARLGGDEFAIVLYDIGSSHDLVPVAEAILKALAEPVKYKTSSLHTSTSIGISIYNNGTNTIGKLIKFADTAMYEAKADGRNNYKFYADNMQKKENEKQHIQIMLHKAITNNELSLVYQPKISLATHCMTSCEALLRWQPENAKGKAGNISPATFIPIAEESGQIIRIGMWVVETVFLQVQQWMLLPEFVDMTVSINVSTHQLQRSSFFPKVKILLQKYNIPPGAIEFEITETGMIGNIDQVIEELKQLHDLGVKISIDDFGTGNSSLDHLRKLPLDILKIDQSFIKDIGIDAQDEEIIRVVMAIAQTMGLQVVAEGAETLEQIQFLQEVQCDFIQGYFFSRPVPPAKISRLLAKPETAFCNQFSKFEAYLEEYARPALIDISQPGAPLFQKNT